MSALDLPPLGPTPPPSHTELCTVRCLSSGFALKMVGGYICMMSWENQELLKYASQMQWCKILDPVEINTHGCLSICAFLLRYIKRIWDFRVKIDSIQESDHFNFARLWKTNGDAGIWVVKGLPCQHKAPSSLISTHKKTGQGGTHYCLSAREAKTEASPP